MTKEDENRFLESMGMAMVEDSHFPNRMSGHVCIATKGHTIADIRRSLIDGIALPLLDYNEVAK